MPTRPLEGSAFAGRDGCPQPSVRGQTCVAPSTSYSLWSTGRDSTTCCPSCLSALGRDGCPQPSVRGQTHAPHRRSYSLSGQRRVGDNPPYPRQLFLPSTRSPRDPVGPGRDSTTCCPSCLSALGRDGCPQPSVRRQTRVPRSTSYPLPLPRLYSQPLTANRFHLAAPPSLP